MQVKLKHAVIQVLHKMDTTKDVIDKAIRYVQRYGDDQLIDYIPTLGACGFAWALTSMGDSFWLNIDVEYSRVMTRYVNLNHLMTGAPELQETNLKRLLFLINYLPISKNTKRRTRKDLLQMFRKGDLYISTDKGSAFFKYSIVNEIATWSNSPRGDKSTRIRYAQLDTLMHELWSTNRHLFTDPLPMYSLSSNPQVIENVPIPIVDNDEFPVPNQYEDEF